MALTLAPRRIVENRQLVSHFGHRGKPDTFLAPTTVFPVQYNGFLRGIPMVEVSGPIDPDCIGVLETFQADVVGEQKPSATLEFEVQRCVLDLLRRGKNRLRVYLPGAVQVSSPSDADRAVRAASVVGRGTEEHAVIIPLADNLTSAG